MTESGSCCPGNIGHGMPAQDYILEHLKWPQKRKMHEVVKAGKEKRMN